MWWRIRYAIYLWKPHQTASESTSVPGSFQTPHTMQLLAIIVNHPWKVFKGILTGPPFDWWQKAWLPLVSLNKYSGSHHCSKDVWMCSIPAVWCRLLWDAALTLKSQNIAPKPIFAYLGRVSLAQGKSTGTPGTPGVLHAFAMRHVFFPGFPIDFSLPAGHGPWPAQVFRCCNTCVMDGKTFFEPLSKWDSTSGTS